MDTFLGQNDWTFTLYKKSKYYTLSALFPKKKKKNELCTELPSFT